MRRIVGKIILIGTALSAPTRPAELFGDQPYKLETIDDLGGARRRTSTARTRSATP